MEVKYRKSVIHQTVSGEDMETEVMLPDFGDEQEASHWDIGTATSAVYPRTQDSSLY